MSFVIVKEDNSDRYWPENLQVSTPNSLLGCSGALFVELERHYIYSLK